MSSTFQTSPSGEPHFARRHAIYAKHPEIKKLFGYDTRTANITYAVVFAQIAIAYVFSKAYVSPYFTNSRMSFWALLLLVVYVFGAIASKWGGVTIHESSHNLVYRTTFQNRMIALFANTHLLVPSAMSFRRYHMDHHTHLGIVGRDNDLAMDFEIRWLGRNRIAKFVWLTFYVFFATLARGFLKKPDRWEVIGFFVQMSVNIVIAFLVGPIGITYLALSTFFGFGLHPVAGHFIHEHYSWIDNNQETYSYYGPLNRVTLNLGYHNEHHDFMAVPSRFLPELHEIAKDTYGKLHAHHSWSKIMYHFVMNPKLGHHSRISRTEDVLFRSFELRRQGI